MSKHPLFGTKHCDRCGEQLGAHVMSMFNLDTLCMSCKDKEKLHPDYDRACEVERQAVQNGVRNFAGIGKPKDL